MYKWDLIFRPWKTLLKYIQNQGEKPFVGPWVLTFVGKTVLLAVAWPNCREGNCTDSPDSLEGRVPGKRCLPSFLDGHPTQNIDCWLLRVWGRLGRGVTRGCYIKGRAFLSEVMEMF